MSASSVVGVDVGGTFTDIFVFNETTRKIVTNKVPSTPKAPAQAFLNGVLAATNDISSITTLLHGTTVATNALLQDTGAKTGLITTSGFADVLEMRRRDRPSTWGLRGNYKPVIERDLRLEVSERTLADGQVHTPVNCDDVIKKAQHLLSLGCEAVCLFFINGYANKQNEQAAATALRSVWPNSFVSVAHEIVPEIREFERLSTTALNARLQPLVSGYLDQLEQKLSHHAFKGDLMIVQSNGGVMNVEMARQVPVRTALSGPAAGVIAAQAIAGAAGIDDIVTCDMGGTSFDVALVAEGKSALAAQASIGFGRVVRTPMIEITTIGAGGGSLARVDAEGILKVGPESAGSDPGPVCYGLGNTVPTVTDANLVLGKINATRPIGGALRRLDVEAATRAIDEHIARPLRLDTFTAADAILRVTNAQMAGAIRLVSIERGHDPTRFAAMPFGGGGALHTGALMQDVGLQAALVPRYPGITSALGCVVADIRHDRVQTVNQTLADADTVELSKRMHDVVTELTEQVNLVSAVIDSVEHRLELDMLYTGQTHAVAVPLPQQHGTYTAKDFELAFNTAYKKAYGRLLEGIPIRILNFRAVVIGRRPAFDMQILGGRKAESKNPVSEDNKVASRRVWISGNLHDTPVYQRPALDTQSVILGPALIEQDDTTVFVDPGLVAHTDIYGNLIIRRAGSDQ